MSDGADQNDENIFDQINAICKEFSRALRAGQQPKIEDWLSRVGGKAEATLFANLLAFEVNHRLRQEQTPTSADYLFRFSPYSSQVRQILDESTWGSVDGLARKQLSDWSYPTNLIQKIERVDQVEDRKRRLTRRRNETQHSRSLLRATRLRFWRFESAFSQVKAAYSPF